MKFPRVSGLLLHPTSLPGPYGIGELGEAAHRFADFLAEARQGIWQVLPLGPTGYGDSPYQCFSAFAGNPLLISLGDLVAKGLITTGDMGEVLEFCDGKVDYGRVIEFKKPLLKKACQNFKSKASLKHQKEFEAFCRKNSAWLDDFALFMAAKEAHHGQAWTKWEASLAARHHPSLARWRRELAEEIECHKFSQFLFFTQWADLRLHCHRMGIKIMGDIPIYVAHDSSDVWANPELFHLDEDGSPTVVAGVPPDYFSETGQLWGNPIYRWDILAKSGFRWWVERFQAALSLVDIVRLDHFRGFEAYWEVPGDEKTAVNGRWVKGPGAALFEALEHRLGKLPIVAEDLGVITPEVEALRERFGFPGMAILQFAFGPDPLSPGFIPYSFTRDLVVYTGTHDNDTTVGWWNDGGAGNSTRSKEEVKRERGFVRRYFNSNGDDIHWVFIRGALSSVADVCITPLQDVLGLGSEARMNLPSRAKGNWQWRFRFDMLTEEVRERLKELTVIYGRSKGWH